MPQDRRSALQTTPGAHPRGRAVSGPPWSLAPPASLREERQLTVAGAACDSLDALITDLAGGHGASQGKGGRPKKVEGENRARASAVNGKSARRVTYSTRSLAARLAESANPKVRAAWQGYLNGRHKTVHAAAVACGLRADGHNPLVRLKQYWRKASKAERRAFLKFIEEFDQ